MEWGTVAGLLTAGATMLTALGGLAVTVKVMIPNFKVNKETHKIVNQQHTDMVNYQAALISVLNRHGIEIPVDQSKPPPSEGGI